MLIFLYFVDRASFNDSW